MSCQIVYLPIGVGTFHMPSAQDQFERSSALLRSLDETCLIPEKILLSVGELEAFTASLHPDLIILQNITFANAAYASSVASRFDCPILLWSLREPVIDGTRLRLNSLTGAFSAGNAITSFRGEGGYDYIFGSPEEPEVVSGIRAVIRAARVRKDLQNLKMTAIGHTPQGFGFGRALDIDMLKTFGTTLESIEARELIEKANTYTDADAAPELAEAKEIMVGLDTLPEKNVLDFARLYKAYKTYVQENGIGAVCSRCWPDFFTSYGTPVCSVLSMLNALGVSSSCESDAYGALSMYVGSRLTSKACFFGDPVSLDEKENTVTFWHCGMAACTLARKDTGAQVGVHPNRKIGPVMDFGCEACDDVTIFRIGRRQDGTFRFLIAQGSALDKPKQFNGTSVVVRTENSARDLVYGAVKGGWEPHYVVVYGNVADELEKLAGMLKLEVCRF